MSTDLGFDVEPELAGVARDARERMSRVMGALRRTERPDDGPEKVVINPRESKGR